MTKFGSPVRTWYYLTFRVSSRLYPTRLELFSWALQAGGIIRKNFGKTLKADWKKDRTPVTKVDRSINQLYVKKTGRRYKHMALMGEEGWSRASGSTIGLCTDEWDGTIPGILGVAATTTVASVVVDGVVVATIIHHPTLKRTWYAEKGKGAFAWNGGWLQWLRMWLADHGLAFLWKDHGLGERIHVSDRPLENSSSSLMWWAGSVGNFDEVRPQLDAIPGAHWHNFNAVAISGGLIAEGMMVASAYGGTDPRETMAMERLVVEAGGFATDVFGGDLVYAEDPENPFQLKPIRGHLICNTKENHERFKTILTNANPSKKEEEESVMNEKVQITAGNKANSVAARLRKVYPLARIEIVTEKNTVRINGDVSVSTIKGMFDDYGVSTIGEFPVEPSAVVFP